MKSILLIAFDIDRSINKVVADAVIRNGVRDAECVYLKEEITLTDNK